MLKWDARVGAETRRPTQRAIVCSAQHWDASVHLSAHHLATYLVDRGWMVAFLSTPTSLLHRLRFRDDPAQRQRYENWRQGGVWAAPSKLFYYTPLALLPPSRLPVLSASWVMRSWVQHTWPSLPRLLTQEGFASPDVMICDTALMQPLWQALGRPRLVYRVTDRNRDFPGKPAGLDGLERELAQAAELVVSTGSVLSTYVRTLGVSRHLCIPNGVDVAHFAAPRPFPAAYAAIPRPRALYVGSIADWFDEELLADTARRHPGIAFVVIGPGSSRLARLAGLRNVHLLGPQPYADVPALMQHADVGLIPFGSERLAAFIDDINPLKLYEYMAAGLPVVSTPMRQVAELGSPARIAGGSDFSAAVGLAVSDGGDRTAERAFAAQFDWSKQFAPLATRLGL